MEGGGVTGDKSDHGIWKVSWCWLLCIYTSSHEFLSFITFKEETQFLNFKQHFSRKFISIESNYLKWEWMTSSRLFPCCTNEIRNEMGWTERKLIFVSLRWRRLIPLCLCAWLAQQQLPVSHRMWQTEMCPCAQAILETWVSITHNQLLKEMHLPSVYLITCPSRIICLSQCAAVPGVCSDHQYRKQEKQSIPK